MRINLLMINEEEQRWIQLDGSNEYLLGREEGALIIQDERCSRKHALLFLNQTNHLSIRDLGSTNGTIVNQAKTSETILKVNDVFKIGATVFVVMEVDTGSADGSTATIIFSSLGEKEMEGSAPLSYQDQSGQKASPLGSALLNSWPNMVRAMPKEALKNFVSHLDEDQKRKSKRLIEILGQGKHE